MKILVLSDSHYHNLDSLSMDSFDAVCHCGDYGFSKNDLIAHHGHYVRGNCDLEGPKHLLFQINSKKIWITHGDLENVKHTLDRLVYKAQELECDICLFGHTHQSACFIEEGILFLNPGSYPNSYAVITDHAVLLYQSTGVKKFKYEW